MLTLDELSGGFMLDDWEVLPSQRILRRGQQVERPEPMVFDVLLALARSNGDLVTKDELIDEVWQGRAFSDEVIQQKISQLRSHLEDKKPYQFIGTLPRKGYQLLRPVELLVRPASEEPGPPVSTSGGDRRWKLVALAVVVGFLATVWLSLTDLGRTPDVEQPASCSLAVLPIENLSGDPNNLYIADGIQFVTCIVKHGLVIERKRSGSVFVIIDADGVAHDLCFLIHDRLVGFPAHGALLLSRRIARISPAMGDSSGIGGPN